VVPIAARSGAESAVVGLGAVLIAAMLLWI
jgi:hypothetical protein